MTTWVRRTVASLPLIVALSWPVAAPARQPLARLTTIHGKTYEDCRILQEDPDGVYISHSQGLAKLLFTDLVQSDRKSLGYNPEKEAAYYNARMEKRERQRADLAAHNAEIAAAVARQERLNMEGGAAYTSLAGEMPAYPAYGYDGGIPFIAAWGDGYGYSPYGMYSMGGWNGGCYSPFGNRFFDRPQRGSSSFRVPLNPYRSGYGNYLNVYGNAVRPVRRPSAPFATPALSGATAPLSRATPPLAPVARPNLPRSTPGRTAVGGGAHK